VKDVGITHHVQSVALSDFYPQPTRVLREFTGTLAEPARGRPVPAVRPENGDQLIAYDGTVAQLIPPRPASFNNLRRPVTVYSLTNPDKTDDDLPYGNYVLAIEADGQWTVRLIRR